MGVSEPQENISRLLPHALGLVTRLADDPVEVALRMAREIAGRSPHAVRGAKKLINHLSNERAKEHFAVEREIIFKLIGTPNQVEAITANFKKREPRFGAVGRAEGDLARDPARHA